MAKISKSELEKYDLNVLIKIYNESDGFLGTQINLLDKANIIDNILIQEEWSINEMKTNKKYKEKIHNKKIELEEKASSIPRLKHQHHTGCSFIEDSDEEDDNWRNNYYDPPQDSNWLWEEIDKEPCDTVKTFLYDSF